MILLRAKLGVLTNLIFYAHLFIVSKKDFIRSVHWDNWGHLMMIREKTETPHILSHTFKSPNSHKEISDKAI